MGVGMPLSLILDEFGQLVSDAFDGEVAYLVGSCLREKAAWRDVDVRLILDDETYAAAGLGDPKQPHQNVKWRSLVLAYCALGKQMTGLPIDFQIQQRTEANSEFKSKEGHSRSALGIVVRLARQRALEPQSAGPT